MTSFILKKPTSLFLRLFQILLLTAIFSLEFAQIQGFKPWYYEEPSHGNASYYWLIIFITYILLLYYLTSFSYRWITGPYLSEIYSDLFLAHLWFIISLINISSEFTGTKIVCDYPQDINYYARTTRCQLFISSMSLSWIVAATYVISSYVSIMKWRKRPIEAKSTKFVEPPIVIHKPETYVVQKGVLADGQPALFFTAQKNNSTTNVSRGGASGNVSPTSSHNASSNNLHGFTHHANTSKTSIYLHDKDVSEV
ncbi:uncharacterized protein OCT59_013659 [Rhizophagus irregularis]|uniref:MARVEL domain-containing protein n=2 Tax=Rhizophagus irregularis TaxID=588596 RepID=U9URA6_RHIID|nr:hypothetical protein GLOIN_2v1543823 [Rhizophagus irregularis DAOM 181602=DAOM 197198]UZO21261.1 hypothetical protein OCT59_013659 [Rhizophagus irregularis]POG77802.1 hypothetical protein GLOIN_2v1543823 [Rhizophagus irregularis DAOM 181602=DAOM 197198]CAB4388985.1 unnamed protein product [Rhizophagus irregularis]CAB4479968.1 unnamed protein product [Rhizophagus irregularis]CAB5204367.1 unnamed protein product [Rhizophagus irregularis]|eukprot:XP_025184668.1 hypothetical protein GLOIN_2v1543823 [Rhizophagus irregularis DAOM 181602=DAOM 197198]